jgi:glycosyltransferase involved in cell wall biosynthesis
MINHNILFVMPEPYSVGGMKAISKMYYDYKIFEEAQYHHFDSTFTSSNKISRFFQSILLRFKFVLVLLKLKPKGVFIYTSSYWGFYDKAFYAFICRLFGIKSVLNLVGGEFFKFYHSNLFHSLMVKIFIKFPNKIVIGSTSWIAPFQKEFPNIYYEIIHNPVIIKDEKKVSKNVNNKVRFLFLGRLTKEKGIEEIIQALIQLKRESNLNFHFTFAGKGPLGQYINCKLIDMINSGMVSVFENVSDTKKHELFERSDVFVLPSHAEVLPISLLEAMSHKMPAIITNVGGMKDAVKDGVNGLVIEDLMHPAQELIKHMLYFMNNKKEVEKMGLIAYQTIKDHFEFNTILQKKINLFVKKLNYSEKNHN